MSLQRKFTPKRKAQQADTQLSGSKRRASSVGISPVSPDISDSERLLTNAIANQIVLTSPVVSAPEEGPPSSIAAEVIPVESTSIPIVTENPPNPTDENGPDSGNAISARVWDGTLEQGNEQITLLYTKTKNKKAPAEEMNRRRAAVRAYLFYLEHEVKISPELQAKKVDVALTWITFPREPVDYPKDIVEQAGRVYTKFQEESWGVDADPEEAESDEEVAPDAALPVTRSARTIRADSVRTSAAILPPPSHHIWGIRGIMHGLARKVNKRGGYSYIFDKRYISKKKDFWVIGNNGLTPGAWWPLQRLALFHGAHGSAGGGISGSPIHGCYSIVVSGRSVYHDMDEDRGETLFYSADNSVHNTNRNAVDTITNRTRSLQVSHREGRPVRVLRSQGGTRAYAPKVGIRYDGLYRVVKQLERTNRSGGRYLQFKLQRLEEQRPFAETVAAAPTAQQQRDFHESRREYH